MQAKGVVHQPVHLRSQAKINITRNPIPTQKREIQRKVCSATRTATSAPQFSVKIHRPPHRNLYLKPEQVHYPVAPSMRFFSQPRDHVENHPIDLSTAQGLRWLNTAQSRGDYNFGLALQEQIELQADELIVGFRVQRNYTKFAQTDLYYRIDFSNREHFKHLWESVLAPIQIARQSTVDIFKVVSSHTVWADQIITPHGNLTRLLIGVDFVNHEKLLLGKLNPEENRAYIAKHPEKFKVKSKSGLLVPPDMNQFLSRPK